jgi:hypothetical protein
MYGEAKISADVTLTTPTTFALGTLANGLRFTVEEDEMLVDLEFQGTLNHTVADTEIDATFILDGSDVADLTDGLLGLASGAAAADSVGLYMKKRMRIAKGEHRLQLALRSGAGNVLVMGALRPATLSATRFSHIGTLAHGVDAKAQGIF